MSEILRKVNYLEGYMSYTCAMELFMEEFNAFSSGYKAFVEKTTDIISNHPFKVKKKKRMLYKQYRTNKDKKRATIAANKLPKKLDIKGIETRKAYFYVYVVFQRYLNAHKLGSVVKTNIKNVVDFLNEISKIYNKNTLKKYKQALQWLLRISGKLGIDETLQNINPACDVNYTPRFYTYAQFKMLYEKCKPAQRVSLILCYYSGLRTHEILTILPEDQREPDDRPALETKFKNMGGKRYTVCGKGGLKRLVCIPLIYVDELEKYRLDEPIKILNRGIVYDSYYALPGGVKLSAWFSRYSKKILGFSNGIHGLRHSYAQNRFKTLMAEQLELDIVMRTVSQELGHFRPCITKVYMRGMLSQMMPSIVSKKVKS